MSEKNTELATVNQETRMIPVNGIDDIKALGEILGKSGMFGCKTESEAVMIAAMCHQDGISYSKWMDTNHMIQGRKSKRADAIHADFLRSGGKTKIIKRDGDGVILELTSKEGETSRFSLTWSDALKEPFVYVGREDDIINALENNKTDNLQIKPKYRTPRSRMQMLWARCISDSVRAVDPTCCQGVYTPEEVEDFVDVKPLIVSDNDVKEQVSARAQQTEPAKAKPTKVKKEDYLEAEIIEPEPKQEPKQEPKAKATVKAKPKATPEPKPEPEPKEISNEIEPTPFDEPEEEIDFTLCPIFGQLQGKPWSGMTKSNLEYAKKKYASELKPQHIAAIDAVIAKKE